MAHGCGQCLPCRINRRRLWSSRLVLESFLHESNLFVTLTYAPAHLPADGSVVPRHLKLYLMRCRKQLGHPFRYFAVGEYGERSGRAHYHVIMFGVREVKLVQDCWKFGGVFVGTVTPESAQYVTGYCTKGLTRAGDLRLKGKHPEFTRMSLKPGIGAGAVPELARVVKRHGARYLEEQLDVPRSIRVGGKLMPIGRYLSNRLRSALDRPVGTPAALLAAAQMTFAERMKVWENVVADREARKRDQWSAERKTAIKRLKGMM